MEASSKITIYFLATFKKLWHFSLSLFRERHIVHNHDWLFLQQLKSFDIFSLSLSLPRTEASSKITIDLFLPNLKSFDIFFLSLPLSFPPTDASSLITRTRCRQITERLREEHCLVPLRAEPESSTSEPSSCRWEDLPWPGHRPQTFPSFRVSRRRAFWIFYLRKKFAFQSVIESTSW